LSDIKNPVKYMKRKILNLLLVCSMAAVFAGCIHIHVSSSWESSTGVGNGAVREKEIGKLDFTGIDSQGGTDIVISDSGNGRGASVKVSGDGNLIDYVDVSVIDGILTVRNKEGINWSTRHGLKVIVPNNGKIQTILLSGSSDLTCESVLTGGELAVACRGNCDFSGGIDVRKCELTFSGSSDFKGSLKAESAGLTFRGSSDFSGSVEAGRVEIDCSGSSDCKITGFAEECRISVQGSSDFKGYGFTALKADCYASGSSEIQIACREEISANASGASDICYRGDARVISKSLSGSSNLYNK
jgi:hypothetical protein